MTPSWDWQCFTSGGNCPGHQMLASWEQSRYCPVTRPEGHVCGLSRRKVMRRGFTPPLGLLIWDEHGRLVR